MRSAHMHHMGGFDCTHFCEPSGVLDAWTDGMLLLLGRARGRALRDSNLGLGKSVA